MTRIYVDEWLRQWFPKRCPVCGYAAATLSDWTVYCRNMECPNIFSGNMRDWNQSAGVLSTYGYHHH